MVLKTPRITTGAAVAVQASQNSSVQETDLVEEMIDQPIATISGFEDVSVQLFDRSDPAIADVVLAAELGRALGAELDRQILAGTGANGQMLGLISVTGIGTTGYTDASPTPQEAFVKILQAASDLSVAFGNVPTATLVHPRRMYWFSGWRDSATGIPAARIPWPGQLYTVPAISTVGGSGSNEDYALVLRVEELPVYLGAPMIEVLPEIGSGTLTVRVRARQYASGLFARRPEAIQKISGTGFAGASFT
jgi:Phage capsid family